MADAPKLLEQVRKAVKLVRSTQTQTNEGQVKTNEGQVKTTAGQTQTNEGQVKTNEGQVKTTAGQTQTNEGQTESTADNHSFIHRLAGVLLDGGVTIVPTSVIIKDQFLIVDYLLTYEDEQLAAQSAGRSMMEALTDLLRTLSGSIPMGHPSGIGGSQQDRGFPGEQGVPSRIGGSQRNTDPRRECANIINSFCKAHGLDVEDTKDAYIAGGGTPDPEMLKAWLRVHYSLGRPQ
nr:MAG TPA: hypothetical protein [Caudoviricetes sp.]